jgi:glucokinase
MRTVLAVDLGGTKTATALIDDNARLSELRRDTAARELRSCVEQIAARAQGVEAVGVIVPGIYDTRTGMAWCPNLWGGAEVPLRDSLAAALDAPVVIDNDRAGYVLGEQWLGAARGLRDVVFVAIGTGIGVGLMVDGRVVSGAHGIAGAAGWWALNPQWQDVYASTGCWESEASGPAVARLAGMANAETVLAAARRGDASPRSIVASAARYTGMAVANLISLMNPEMVVLGGGFMHGAADLMLDRIREEAARWAQPVAMTRTRIELTALGDSAGLLGAARLAHLHLSHGETNVSEKLLPTHQ